MSREYPPFFGGGIGTYARNIAPALAEAGCFVHVVTQTYDLTHPRVETRGRLTVHRVPCAGAPAGWTGAVMRFSSLAGRKVAELAARGDVDVAEFAECEGAGAFMATLRAAGGRAGAGRKPARIGVPCVIHLHTPTEQLFALRSIHDTEMTTSLAAYILAERASLLMAERVCAPSMFIARWAERHYGLPERPTVIPYAIEGLPDRPAASPGSGERRVLYLGRIEPRKGVEPLVRAWRRVAAARPGWRLRMVGSDTSTLGDGRSMRARLKGLLTPESAATVEFVEAVPPRLLAREFAGASVCVVPSLWENFPNTCIEAMSYGRPVVVSDEGGMAEMIGGTEAGVVFRSGDADDLAEKLTAMLGEAPERLTARGEAGRARIGAMCDKDAVVGARIALYESAIARAEAPAPASSTALRLKMWRQMQEVGAGRTARIGEPKLACRMGQWLAAEAAP